MKKKLKHYVKIVFFLKLKEVVYDSIARFDAKKITKIHTEG